VRNERGRAREGVNSLSRDPECSGEQRRPARRIGGLERGLDKNNPEYFRIVFTPP